MEPLSKYILAQGKKMRFNTKLVNTFYITLLELWTSPSNFLWSGYEGLSSRATNDI